MGTQRWTYPSTDTRTKETRRPSVRIFFGALSLLGLLVFVALVGIVAFMERGPRNGSSLRLVSETSLPATRSLLFGTDYATVRDHVLYVSYSSADALLAIDTRANTIRTFASHLDGLHGVAFSVDPSLTFISVGGANEIAVLEMPAGASKRDVPAGDDPDGIVFDKRAEMACAGNGKSNAATLVL